MNNALVALVLTQIEENKGLEKLLYEMVHRILKLEDRVKALEGLQ